MTRLGAFTSPEVAAGPSRVLVVPIGSIEQHGPHLPLDTDVRIAEAVAARIVDASVDFVLGPTLPVGAAGEHAGFAGTLSIGTAALTDVLVELRRSLGSEFDGLAVVNGHGGNHDALVAAEHRCREEGRDLRTWTVRLPGADAHAGRTETSLMLAIAPEMVRLDLAEAGVNDPVADLLPALRLGGVAAVSPNGVLGDPAGASATEGETLLARLVASAAATLAP
jgi:creatinine amidohydrolase